MIKDEYSPYKIVHHPDKITQFKQGKQPYPLQVQIVPSNACCQRCTFCAYRMSSYLSNECFDEKDILSYSKIIEILDCMVDMGVGALQVTGGGEPLVHPRILNVFQEVFKRKIELALVSNGQLLTQELCDLLGDVAWIRISMDSASPAIYSFIRNVSNKVFYKVCENIATLVKFRRSSVIGVGFVVERENFKEIYQAAKFYKDMGIDNFRISAAFTPMGYEYFDGFLEEARELSKKSEELSDKDFTVFNLFNDRVRDTFEGKQNYSSCPIKDLMVYIGADYNVYTCCTLAYNARGLIGSIRDQSFKQLWESKEKKDRFSMHDPSKHCQHSCMYRDKNIFINYCIKKDAKHTNFI